MGEVSFTPGPWALIEFGGPQIGNPETGEAVCTMWGSDWTDPETREVDPWRANARLIAAAPDLLEACRKALPWLVTCDDPRSDGALHQLEAAISKATVSKGGVE